MLIENQELYQTLESAIKNMFVEIHAIYAPDGGEPYPDCYLAAVDLFSPGTTYKLYFKINENGQIQVEYLGRWYFG